MEEVLKSRYASNPKLVLTLNKKNEFVSKEIPDLGEITDIEITERLTGGVADEMVITAKKASV